MKEYIKTTRSDSEKYSNCNNIEWNGFTSFFPHVQSRMTIVSALYSIYDTVRYLSIFSDDYDEIINIINLEYGDLGNQLGKIWMKIGYNKVDNAVIDISSSTKIVLASNAGFIKNMRERFSAPQAI